jgi:hypothetical protein
MVIVLLAWVLFAFTDLSAGDAVFFGMMFGSTGSFFNDNSSLYSA